MARTKKSARRPRPDRCELLQLMGFPRRGDDAVKPAEARADWPAVVEQLAHHPNEALHREVGLEPLLLALANETTPVTADALEALIEAHPRVLWLASVEKCGPHISQHVRNTLQGAKQTYLCGPIRTRTFQIMGFPASCDESLPPFHFESYGRGYTGYQVDWPALESHLEGHPEEAKILCPDRTGEMLFPIEAALKFAQSLVPLSTIELLLRLHPKALMIPDSPSLYFACCIRQRDDPNVVRAILRRNPSLASSEVLTVFQKWENMGLPIHEAVKLRCAADILPDLIEACPASLEAQTDMWRQIPLQVAVADQYEGPPLEVLHILLERGHRHGTCAGSGGQLFAKGYDECDDVGRCAMDEMMELPGLSARKTGIWRKLFLALRTAGAFRTGASAEEMWDYPLLHAAVEFGRRRKFIFDLVYAETGPADRRLVDPLGRTPLAVAIESANIEQNNNHDWDDEEEKDFLKLDTVISLLLEPGEGWPQSASIPIAGTDGAPSLPLHGALHQGIGLEEGSRHILNAFPEALAVRDPATKLIPCLLAAVGEKACVNTIFGLMMKRRDMMVDLCKHSGED